MTRYYFVPAVNKPIFDVSPLAKFGNEVANIFDHISMNDDNGVPGIKDVIFNEPATIVFWTDGTKTVVKASGEAFDKEKGLAMAIARKAMGNRGSYFETFRKWCGE